MHFPSRNVTSPVDGTLLDYGRLDVSGAFEVKGSVYWLDDFFGDANVFPYKGGFYMIFYLSPRDYHWVHHPMDGIITATMHVPGRLLPVNTFALKHFPKVYGHNKRISIHYRASIHNVPCVMSLVGALNVGKIQMTYHKSFYQDAEWSVLDATQERPLMRYQKASYTDLPAAQGDPCAVFNLGSTVLLFFPGGSFIPIADLTLNQACLMGMQLGSWR